MDDKWKKRPLSLHEVFAAYDKGLDSEKAELIRNRFNAYSEFIMFLGKLTPPQKGKTMFLFFDTETTGLPKSYGAPASDLDNWPRLVQLAWLAFDADGKRIDGQTAIIKPDGFEIPKKASDVHGITTEIAVSIGESLKLHLNLIHYQISMASVLVGHNISFDEKVLGAEFIRAQLPKITPARQKVCTMLTSTNFCSIPGNRGNKWPKLAELHRKLFNADFDGAHDAGSDVAATAKCFWELRRLGVIKI